MSDAYAELVCHTQKRRPIAAVVLGSGLGAVLSHWTPLVTVPFAQVPGLAAPTVSGHSGQLILAEWAERRLLLFLGRLHYYEGHSWDRVAAPIRLAAERGASILLVTNAAGGIRADLTPGRLMALADHLRWNCPQPHRQLGPGERPSPYSRRLGTLMRELAQSDGWDLAEGVYAAVTGPSYETPAEIRALRKCGADAVGMSTAFEVETAYQLGLECAALSCITNRAAGLSDSPLDHREVLDVAQTVANRAARLLSAFVAAL